MTDNIPRDFPRGTWEFINTSGFDPSLWLELESEEVDGTTIFFHHNKPDESWVGKKIECMGYDRSKETDGEAMVTKLMSFAHKVLDQPGWWIEANPSLSQTLINGGQTPSYRYKDLLKLFPDITKFNTDGSYVRAINGTNHTEYVFGNFVLR